MSENSREKILRQPLPEGGLLSSELWADLVRAEGGRVREFSGGPWGRECRLPLASYLYFPRPDLREAATREKFAQIVHRLRAERTYSWLRVDLAKKEEFDFLRRRAPEGVSLVRSPTDMQPRTVFLVPLSSPEEMLARMKSKTRYNVRLAMKKGVRVESTSRGEADFETNFAHFCRFLRQTARRKNIKFHPFSHYRLMFETFPTENILLQTAFDGDLPLAAQITVFYSRTATYLHGASGEEKRFLMAPYLLQYRAMVEALSCGMENYDFGGVFPDSDDPSKKGLDFFKFGFAPKIKPLETFGSVDIVFSPARYRAYRALHKMRSLLG